MIDTVLAMDIGTTSLKSGLITDRGEVVSFYTYRFDNPCDRFIGNEWVTAFGISVKKIVEKGKLLAGGDLHIKGVSISGNGPTVVLSTGMTVRWNQRLPQYNIPTEQGRKSLFLPKILALKNLFPEDFKKSEYIFSGPEYLIYNLTSNAVTVLPESRFETAYWNSSTLESVDISPSKLPPFVGVGELCGCITKETVSGLGIGRYIKPGTPVFSAGPDFVAALIGTNTLSEGRICDRSGSSEGFNFCVPRPVFSEGARSLPSVIPGLWNISVLTPISSRLSVDKRLKRVAASVEKLRQIAEENNLPFPDSMVVTGGQAKAREYMKRKARLVKMNLIVSACSDAELMGDACCGWLGLGAFSSLKEAANSIVKESIIYEGL